MWGKSGSKERFWISGIIWGTTIFASFALSHYSQHPSLVPLDGPQNHLPASGRAYTSRLLFSFPSFLSSKFSDNLRQIIKGRAVIFILTVEWSIAPKLTCSLWHSGSVARSFQAERNSMESLQRRQRNQECLLLGQYRYPLPISVTKAKPEAWNSCSSIVICFSRFLRSPFLSASKHGARRRHPIPGGKYRWCS